MIGYCQCCGKRSKLDKCHIKTKGSGGSLDPENIYFGCRKCHTIQHAKGFKWMADNFPLFKMTLFSKGWEFKDIFGVTKLLRKDG